MNAWEWSMITKVQFCHTESPTTLVEFPTETISFSQKHFRSKVYGLVSLELKARNFKNKTFSIKLKIINMKYWNNVRKTFLLICSLKSYLVSSRPNVKTSTVLNLFTYALSSKEISTCKLPICQDRYSLTILFYVRNKSIRWISVLFYVKGSTGVIAGAVCGCLAVLVLLTGAICLLYRHKQAKHGTKVKPGEKQEKTEDPAWASVITTIW